jgi:two-component system, chemotaxis family, chemotaxis protein CheY
MSVRVLVIDDSESIRLHLRSILESAGYEVEVASDGSQGTEALKTGNFDCVLCDLNMPKVDGLQLVKTVKTEPRNKSLPILMLSTDGSVELIKQAQLAGAAGWIVKPYTAEQVLNAIKNLTKIA